MKYNKVHTVYSSPSANHPIAKIDIFMENSNGNFTNLLLIFDLTRNLYIYKACIYIYSIVL